MGANAAKLSMGSAKPVTGPSALNPYSSHASAALGGVSMAIDASKNVNVIPYCALIVQAANAFRNERNTEAGRIQDEFAELANERKDAASSENGTASRETSNIACRLKRALSSHHL